MSSDSDNSSNFNAKLTEIWSTNSDKDSSSESESESLRVSDSISNHPGFEEFMKEKQKRDEIKAWQETLRSFILMDLDTHKDVIPTNFVSRTNLFNMSVEELETTTKELNNLISAASIKTEEAYEASSSEPEDAASWPSIFTVSSNE